LIHKVVGLNIAHIFNRGSINNVFSFGRVFVASLAIALVVVSVVIDLVTGRISYGHNFLWKN
jgi:hypothetical protein